MLAASAHLTGRDRHLVRLVGEHRVLTTGQLAALGFGSLTTARHRLAVLVRIGLLRRFRPHPPTGSAPWHYVLGPVGAALLGAEDRDERRWAPQARADRQLGLERSPRLGQMTGRNWFVAARARHAREHGGELAEWLNEADTAARYEYAAVRSDDRARLPRPDGAGTWAEDGQTVSFWLEFDTGTEHLAVLAAKLDGYAVLAGGLASHGQPCPVLLFCFGSPRREQAARRALAATSQAGGLRIATAALDPAVVSPAGPAWLPLHQAAGPAVRLAGLEQALPDPWRDYRERRAREHQEAARREQALLDADPDDDEPGTPW
ncbi:MAG: replication-relaxation family protein [Streptosporangiaceae bacterium]